MACRRARDSFLVQRAGDCAWAYSGCEVAEYAPHDMGLSFIDLAFATDRFAARIQLLHDLLAI